MNFSPEDVRQAIDGLRLKFGRSEDSTLQNEFDAGLHPNLLSYGKLGASIPSLPILDKYLVGATSFLHQPSNYYDIFRACRCVYVVQLLDAALATLLDKNVRGVDARMERICRAVEHDPFDAVLYELVTAARYAEHPDVSEVRFIRESPGKKTPDFLVKMGGVESSVECKKVDRNQNFTITIRNAVRDLLNAVIESFRAKGLSVLTDVSFNCDPHCVSPSRLADACHEALEQGTAIVESDFNVTAVRLPPFRSDGYILYPSPSFDWMRYAFRVRGGSFGVVQQLYGSRAVKAGLPPRLQGGTSSWINEIEWDGAVKWRISSEEVVARYRRFAFDGVFKGLQQIKTGGVNSVVHLWLETEYCIGSRRNALVDLLRRVSQAEHSRFGWIVINETLFDVSPKGRFDLIEHAHFIRGPAANTREAPICGVFTPEDPCQGTAEFGTGADLPDIDDE